LTNTTPEAWREQVRPQAVERLKLRVILTEVIEVEGIEVEDPEVDEAIERVIEPMGDRADDMRQMLNTESGRLSIKQDLLADKAQDLLKSVLKAGEGDPAEAEMEPEKGSAEETEDTDDKPEAAADEPEAAVEKQNLTKIEGIGPKTSGLLDEAGIYTYEQLADAEIDQLKEILEAAGPRYRIIKPDTWPMQAQLAAEEKWDELQALKDRISGGVLVEQEDKQDD
jgi:predicted flap endonuclease-1-like 5' DNA nuclease